MPIQNRRTSKKKCWLFVSSLCILTLLTVAPNLASNMQEGPPLKAKVMSARQKNPKSKTWEVSARLLVEPYVPQSGHYDSKKYKLGTMVTFETLGMSKQPKKGELIMVKWQSYSAMGPQGPVGGLSWHHVPWGQ